jgi:hypothetical protein
MEDLLGTYVTWCCQDTNFGAELSLLRCGREREVVNHHKEHALHFWLLKRPHGIFRRE